MTKMATKAKNKWDSLNESTQKIATIITSLLVIGGAFFGATNYLENKLDEHISAQTNALKSELSEVKLSSTRNELLLMMQSNPTNVLEIERLAKHYFIDMNGNFYMTQKYSDWAKQYGGDTSFMTK